MSVMRRADPWGRYIHEAYPGLHHDGGDRRRQSCGTEKRHFAPYMGHKPIGRPMNGINKLAWGIPEISKSPAS